MRTRTTFSLLISLAATLLIAGDTKDDAIKGRPFDVEREQMRRQIEAEYGMTEKEFYEMRMAEANERKTRRDAAIAARRAKNAKDPHYPPAEEPLTADQKAARRAEELAAIEEMRTLGEEGREAIRVGAEQEVMQREKLRAELKAKGWDDEQIKVRLGTKAWWVQRRKLTIYEHYVQLQRERNGQYWTNSRAKRGGPDEQQFPCPQWWPKWLAWPLEPLPLKSKPWSFQNAGQPQ